MNLRSDFTRGLSRISRTSPPKPGDNAGSPKDRASYRFPVETTKLNGRGSGDGRSATIEESSSPPSQSPKGYGESRYHNSYDIKENFWNRIASAWLLGLAATAGLFLALPFFQLISTVGTHDSGVVTMELSKPPPPSPPVEKPPPPEKKDQAEQPELKQELPKLTLSQLELALNPGMGDATAGGDFSMDFQVHAMEELEMIFELSEVDRIPQPIYRVAPVFPYEMKQAGISGAVALLFICDSQGRVRQVRVKSSSHREFDQAAINALRQWKFEPGIKNGEAVNVRILIPFRFSVTER